MYEIEKDFLGFQKRLKQLCKCLDIIIGVLALQQTQYSFSTKQMDAHQVGNKRFGKRVTVYT